MPQWPKILLDYFQFEVHAFESYVVEGNIKQMRRMELNLNFIPNDPAESCTIISIFAVEAVILSLLRLGRINRLDRLMT